MARQSVRSQPASSLEGSRYLFQRTSMVRVESREDVLHPRNPRVQNDHDKVGEQPRQQQRVQAQPKPRPQRSVCLSPGHISFEGGIYTTPTRHSF